MEHYIIEIRDMFNDRYDLSYKMTYIIPTTLGKRRYEDAFEQTSYDDMRYGQRVDNDYFQNGGVGHGVNEDGTRRQPDIEEGNFYSHSLFVRKYDIEEGVMGEYKKKQYTESPYLTKPSGEADKENSWTQLYATYKNIVNATSKIINGN
jgi:hypothetical protein